MSESWKPADLAEVKARITAELRSFDPVDHAQWNQLKVEPFKVTWRRSDEYGDEAVFVVAREGSSVLFFDDAEDQFSGAVMDARASLKKVLPCGELKHALRRFKRAA